MEPIAFGRVALETFEWFVTMFGVWASVRALAGLIGWGIPGGFSRPKWLTRVRMSEVWCALFLLMLLATGIKLYKLTAEERIYSAKEVEARLGPVPVERRPAEGQPTVKGIPYANQPDWASDHIYWLEKEGDRDKKAGKIGSYVVAEVEYLVPFPTHAAELVLRVPEGFSIWSRTAIRVFASSSSKSQWLDIKAGLDNFREMRVGVPECDNADKVIVLLRVASVARSAPDDVSGLLHARFE